MLQGLVWQTKGFIFPISPLTQDGKTLRICLGKKVIIMGPDFFVMKSEMSNDYVLFNLLFVCL